MKNRKQLSFVVDQLEPRALLSGFHHGFGGLGGGGFLSAPSVTVQADLTQIRTDQQKLQTDYAAVASTLRSDQQAIATAITAARATTAVTTAQTQLTTDQTAFRSKILADLKAIATAPDAATLGTDITQIRADRAAAATKLLADRQAIQAAITGDPGVVSAEAKYQADGLQVIKDEAQLQVDYAQLRTDRGPSDDLSGLLGDGLGGFFGGGHHGHHGRD